MTERGGSGSKNTPGRRPSLVVTPVRSEAPFNDKALNLTQGPAPTEILSVPSQLAARRVETASDKNTPPPNASDAADAFDGDDLRTVAIPSLSSEPFVAENTESFDPITVDRIETVRREDPGAAATMRYRVNDADATDSGVDAGTEKPQPSWLVSSRPVELNRPPGGAPSAFDPARSDVDLAPPTPFQIDGGTEPTSPNAEPLDVAPMSPSTKMRFAAPIVIAALVATVVGGAGAFLTGSLDPGIATLRALLKDDGSTAVPTTTAPVAPVESGDKVPTESDPAIAVAAPKAVVGPIAVRVDLVNDASGSEFAPLADPLRDKFLATLLGIKPFVADKSNNATSKVRFTLFVGGTDVIRQGDNLMSSSTCSLAASKDGSDAPAQLLKARASVEKVARPIVIPTAPKKKMKRKERIAHEKKVAEAHAKDRARLRDVARAAVARCAHELAQAFAEKVLIPPTAETPPSATTTTTTTNPAHTPPSP